MKSLLPRPQVFESLIKRNLNLKSLSTFVIGLLLTSCAHYQYTQNLKMLAVEEDISAGQSIGPVQGEYCAVHFFGQYLSGAPTIDKAIMDAANPGHAKEVQAQKNGKLISAKFRYINNATVDSSGFNALVFGKTCLSVKGTGYK